MEKTRKKRHVQWLGLCVTMTVLLILLGVEAMLMSRGVLKEGTVQLAALGGALIAAIAGSATMAGKNERQRAILFTGVIPAAILLSLGIIISGGEGQVRISPWEILAMVLPGAILFFTGNNKHYPASRRRKRKS